MSKSIWAKGWVPLVAAGLGAAATYGWLHGVSTWNPGHPAVPGALSSASRTLDTSRLAPLLRLLDAPEREKILGNAETFEAFIKDEARNQAVLGAAYAQAADQEPNAKLLMERGAQRILVEAYLNSLVRGKLDPNAPGANDVRAYYDQNPEQFQIPERMHVWQIFISGKSPTERRNAAALCRQLLESLLSGKADFGAAAQANSKHEQSRVNGGYLGLLALRDLKPEIRDALSGAAEGKIIGPIETADGYHLVKRGSSIPGSTIPFEQAKTDIVDLLRRRAATAARAAVVENITATYPVAIPNQLDTVRNDLRQQLQVSAPPGALKKK